MGSKWGFILRAGDFIVSPLHKAVLLVERGGAGGQMGRFDFIVATQKSHL